jgi:hypothetical protein
VVSRCPRTYSGRDPCPGTVGAHRRLFYGRPRTGACQRPVPAQRAPLSRVCGCFGDRVDGVLTLGYSRQAPWAPVRWECRARCHFAIRPSWRRPALHPGPPRRPVSGLAVPAPSSVAIATRAAMLGLTCQPVYLLVSAQMYLSYTSAGGVCLGVRTRRSQPGWACISARLTAPRRPGAGGRGGDSLMAGDRGCDASRAGMIRHQPSQE